MKKVTLSILVLAFMVLTLACQALSNLAVKAPPTESPIPASTSTVISPTQALDAATATESVQAPGGEGWIAIGNQNNLWLVHPDGSDLTKITSNPPSSSAQTIRFGSWKWSPDGNTLAYVEEVQGEPFIYRFDVAASQILTLEQKFNGGFDWSANGNGFLYDTPMKGDNPSNFKNKGVWELDLTDGKSHLVISPRDGLPAVIEPQVSPDGSHVLFHIPCTEQGCVGHGIANYKTGKPYFLPAEGGVCTWTPLTTQVACIRSVTDKSTGLTSKELTLFATDGKNQRSLPLTESIYTTLAWAPDGQTLAVGYYANGSVQTDLLSLENGDRHFLASGTPSAWSPDGQWVLTWESDPNGNPSKSYVVNAGSAQVYPLAEGTFPIWQPATGNSVIGSSPQDTNSNPTVTPVTSTESTNTPSVNQPCADVSITVKDTNKGDYLEICAEGKNYEIGPLEKGAYAVGPNNKFLVYATNSGKVYAVRIGDTRLTLLGELQEFTFLREKRVPSYDFKFLGEQPYTVQIFETQYNQNQTFSIPRRISDPN